MPYYAIYAAATGALLREPIADTPPDLAEGEALVERAVPPFGCYWSPDARDYVPDPASPVLSPAEQGAHAAAPVRVAGAPAA
jgi:hypothetical protein